MFKYKCKFDTLETHGHQTRNRMYLRTVAQRLNVTQRSISYIGPLTWNSLPSHIKQMTKSHSFKRDLKKYLLSTYNRDT